MVQDRYVPVCTLMDRCMVQYSVTRTVMCLLHLYVWYSVHTYNTGRYFRQELLQVHIQIRFSSSMQYGFFLSFFFFSSFSFSSFSSSSSLLPSPFTRHRSLPWLISPPVRSPRDEG
jgi:hypothetical protein